MSVHFVHVRKTGGLAIKQALLDGGLAFFEGEETHPVPETPYGPIVLHRRHRFRARHVPAGDHFFFFVRDPVARFLSGFYSRQRKGQPRHYVEWSEGERRAFDTFPTPQRLATALGSERKRERRRARAAMRDIPHLRPMWRSVGTPAKLRERADRVVYIGRQETLEADWERLKAVLGLPPALALPADPVLSHRSDSSLDRSLDEAAVEALRHWYRRDYALLGYCDELRAQRGWGPGRRASALAGR